MIKIKVTKTLQDPEGEFQLNLDVEINDNEFITLYGKSGAGKTTTLRILAGLLNPDFGTVHVDDEVWYDSKHGVNLTPQQRGIGLVFQDYALFPNMTVRKNLEYSLDSKKDFQIIDTLLELMGLENLASRKPNSLSGGQQQRVALARALVRKPKLLLLDEPLSALDMEMRSKLQDEILKIHHEFAITTILVSHSFAEIFKLSNRVFVIDKGKITKTGNPADIFIDRKLSGKFKFEGKILALQKSDVVYIATISIGNNIVKVIASDEEARQFNIGDRVVVSSKAFNPILMKIDP
ncbi:ATP-binding cassette domain-containing protein [candidate division KSB1 bacterium]|nr:ATP-binding cassette domain-containing protein [candidate division KSB1 bacterium]